MPVLDLKEQLDAAIWTLLEASAAFTAAIEAGRRIKTYSDGAPRDRTLRAVADYPKVKVEVTGGNLAVNAPKVFAMNSTTFTSAQVDVPVPVTQNATITVTYDKEGGADQSPVEAIIRAALLAKYPTLGISGVTHFTITEPTRTADTSGLPNTRMQLTVTRRPMLSTLV